MASNAAEIATLLKTRLGRMYDPGFDTKVLQEMNQMFRRYERKPAKFWFQVTTSDVEVLATGLDTLITLPPEGFLKELEDSGLEMLVGDQWQPCVKDDYEIVMKKEGVSFWQTPFYCLMGDAFILRPVLDRELSFRLHYYAAAPQLSTLDESNYWVEEAEDLVLGAVGEALAVGIQSPRLQFFQQLRMEAWKDLLHTNTARTEAATVRVMGQ